jgi:hypothetical protein
MKTLILYKNPRHDFSGIKNPHFIFHPFDLENVDLNNIKDKLTETLDKATPEDYILMNGPSYLTAIAGYVWLTQENREFYNLVSYNVDSKKYEYHLQENK